MLLAHNWFKTEQLVSTEWLRDCRNVDWNGARRKKLLRLQEIGHMHRHFYFENSIIQEHIPKVWTQWKNLTHIKSRKLKNLLSFLRALFNSWKSGKLSQESCGCASSAESISTEYRDKNFSACSANNSGHQANACKHDKIELLNTSHKAKRSVVIHGKIHLDMLLHVPITFGEDKQVKQKMWKYFLKPRIKNIRYQTDYAGKDDIIRTKM